MTCRVKITAVIIVRMRKSKVSESKMKRPRENEDLPEPNLLPLEQSTIKGTCIISGIPRASYIWVLLSSSSSLDGQSLAVMFLCNTYCLLATFLLDTFHSSLLLLSSSSLARGDAAILFFALHFGLIYCITTLYWP